MKRSQLTRIRTNARLVALRYKRKCPWVTVEDLEQEAVAAQLDAYPRFDPQRGTPFGVFMWVTAVLACKKAVASSSSPVSCRSEPDKVAGLYGRSYDTTEVGAEALATEPVDQAVLLDRKRISERVRARLEVLVGDDGAEYAISSLTGEFKAKEIAEANDVSVRVVYGVTRRIREAISGDPALYELWRRS